MTQTKNRNILVVDDEPQITRVLKTTLASHGYAIRTARDGDEAVQVMKDWTPDLVITDLRMPNMNGLELVPACARKSASADHRALGPGRGKDQGGGARCRRRRLRHQALQRG